MSSPTAAVLGEVGLPVPIRELTARTWDTIVVGAGHNGLACAAYLARAGQRVLVIESRARVGGACTIEEPFPGVRMSPCAYLAGLLHPLVIEELDLPRRGYTWTPAVNGLFVPFLDGSSIQLWDDDERCATEVRALAPGDVGGWRAMSDVIRRLRDALRPPGDGDLWIGEPPTREQIEDSFGDDAEARAVLFEWSMAEFVENYPQGRTAPDRLSRPGSDRHQRQSLRPRHRFDPLPPRLGPPRWNAGDVGLCTRRHGDGLLLLLRCRARSRRDGRLGRPGRPRSFPARHRCSKAGERISRTPSSPTPTPAGPCDYWAPQPIPAWRVRVEQIPIEGCTVKLNVHLRELPNLPRAPPGALESCRITTARSTPRSPKTNGRPASLPRAAASCPSASGANSTSRVPRPLRRPARRAHHERLRAVRALQIRPRNLGLPPRRSPQAGARLPCPLLLQHSSAVIDAQVMGPPGHRAEGRPHRRPYLPGRVPAALYVG